MIYNDPVDLARRFASLDVLSGGCPTSGAAATSTTPTATAAPSRSCGRRAPSGTAGPTMPSRRPTTPGPGRAPAPSCPQEFGAVRIANSRTTIAAWREASEANGWSLRQTVIELGQRARSHVETPAGLADTFARFVREGALDGFNLTPYLVPDGLDDILERRPPQAV